VFEAVVVVPMQSAAWQLDPLAAVEGFELVQPLVEENLGPLGLAAQVPGGDKVDAVIPDTLEDVGRA
jgi:hypothetical protein